LILTVFNGLIGKWLCNNGESFKGEFLDNNEITGFGRKFNSAGELLFKGFFSKGVLVLEI